MTRSPKPLPRLVFISLPTLFLIGCGDDTPRAVADGSASAGGSAAVAADSSKPAAANQLTGSWFALENEAGGDDLELIGVEFDPDGKRLTLITKPMGGAPAEIPLNVNPLEGGRIRLSTDASAIVSQTMQCNVNGDTLTMVAETKNQMLGFDGGRFQKLAAGKTIVARYSERVKEKQAEAAALGEKLNAFLKQPNLAIVPADAGGVGSLRVALKMSDANATTALLTVANKTVERQAQISASPQSQPPTVTVTLGNVIGPPGAKPMQQESFTFTAKSDNGNLVLRDNQAHVLKPDGEVAKQLADAYAADAKKQRDLLDAFHAKLGALVLAEGEARPNQPTPRAALLRVTGQDQYLMASYRGSEASLVATSFNIPHVVMLQDDQPLLVNPQTRQILEVAGEGDGRTLTGNFGGTNARMKVTRVMSLEDVKAKQNEVKAYLETLKTPTMFAGQFYEAYTYENGKVMPVRLELSSPDGKTLAGKYLSEVSKTEFPVKGVATPTLLGLMLQYEPAVAVTRPEPRYGEAGPCIAEVSLDGAKATGLVGNYKVGDGTNRIILAPAAGQTAELRKKLDAALAAGGDFKWARTGSTGGSIEVLTLALKPGESPDKLAGTAGFRRGTAPLTGTIAEDRGHLVIDVSIPETTPKAQASGTMRLWVVPYGDEFYLSGRREFVGDTQPGFVCYGVAK